MKHTFSRFLSAGLVLGALMAIISCSNALGASLKDPSGLSAGSGKMPVLYVTASVGSPSRTILPSDWTEERASALVYQITDDDDGDAVISDELTYAELKAGLTLYLEVKTWNLTLTGYEPAADGTSADSTKPVLSASAEANLSGGAAAVTFNLQPAASTQAKGDVDVSVTFYDIAEIDHIKYGLFDASNAGAGDVDVTTVTKAGSWTGVAGVSESNSATNQWKIQYTTDTAEAGGDSFFGVIFYNAGGKVLAAYFDSIKIDAGNVSKATIKLDKNIYNTSPVAPDNFDLTQTIFNDGIGYQILDGTPTDAADTLYKAVFTWEDKSDNETGFVIEITDTDTAGTVAHTVDSATATNATVADAAAGNLAEGSLTAGSETATVWLETGKTYTATIKAENSIGESDKVDCVDTEINLFTVTYQLDEGKVKYGAADTDATNGADQTAFVLPYNKNAGVQPLLGADTADIPHVFKDGYQFQEWQDTALQTSVTEIAAGNADNMDVTAVWQKALTVTVTFPSYAEAQSVQLLDTYSEAAVITKPKTDLSVEVSAATPTTGGTLDNVVYTVYGIDGSTPVTNGVVDDTAGELTWTFADTTGLTAGVYRIYVTANYTGADTTTVTPLSGNLYIKITE